MTPASSPAGRDRGWWTTVAVSTLASAYILAAYSSFTRPIWIDEFLHYALGSHRSTAEAWQSISETLPTFNHGQTGIYMLVDYWLLDVFGASALVLRLPSLLAAAFILFSTVRIAVRLRFNPAWTLLLLAAFFGQQNLMHYTGEARPYMPLVAAVTGVLAFYLVPTYERNWFDRVCGGIAILMGVLVHPFFPVYWMALALYTKALHPFPAGWWRLLKDFIRHCDAYLSVPAAIGSIVLAKFTWLQGSPDFHMDPFQWIKGDGLFATFTRISHFQFLGKIYIAVPVALVLGLLAALIPVVRRSPVFRKLAPPLGLVAIALLLSFLLSALSYFREYWILPRQWVASMALCCVAVIWLAREIAELVRARLRFLDLPVLALVAFAVLQAAPSIHRAKRPDIAAVATAIIHPNSTQTRTSAASPEKLPANNDEWVALANANIEAGGPVWPVFRKFYARGD